LYHGGKGKRDILIMQEKKKKFSLIKRNILKYAEYKGISKYEIYQKTGMSRSVLSQNNGLTEDNLLKFLACYSDVNPDWLLTGTGPMLRETNHILEGDIKLLKVSQKTDSEDNSPEDSTNNLNICERFFQVLDYYGDTRYKFSKETGVSEAVLSNIYQKKNPPKIDIVELLLNKYKAIDANWLLTGVLPMLKEGETPAKVSFSVSEFKQRGYAPYYPDLLVSAGQFDLAKIEKEEKPSSWIKIPGVLVDAWFPIVGCSMEPKVYAGDTIGVTQVERWDRLDPDKTYLIITREDRMIKHLEVDAGDPEILWAVSENYHRFKIPTEDIIRIFRVVWVGKLI
jgi:transcriptional regulator with XRE-family HTH domain